MKTTKTQVTQLSHLHLVKKNDQYSMNHLQNICASQQYFVDRNVQEMQREYAHCTSEIYLNMGSVLLIHVLLQIFQISLESKT